MDKYTRYGFFIPCHTTINAPGVADLLWSHLFKHFGLPHVIISDWDPHFLSTFWQSLAKRYHTKLAMSSAAHPQTDGQTEVLNQHLEVMLHAYVNSSRNDWDQFLDVLMFAYNNSMHTTTVTTRAQPPHTDIPQPRTDLFRSWDRVHSHRSHDFSSCI